MYMVTCPYCGTGAADSEDHVFPQFLAGRRKIPACRLCNSTFGHTFEATVADALEPIYVQLAAWGVPLQERVRSWNAAYEVDGVRLDLFVGATGVKARSPAPIVIEGPDGSVAEAYFVDSKGLERFRRVRAERHPGEQWMPATKEVKTDLKGLQWGLELGPELQQLALKMVVACSTLLPRLGQEDRTRAREVLQADIRDAHPLVAHYMQCPDGIVARRPALVVCGEQINHYPARRGRA